MIRTRSAGIGGDQKEDSATDVGEVCPVTRSIVGRLLSVLGVLGRKIPALGQRRTALERQMFAPFGQIEQFTQRPTTQKSFSTVISNRFS